MARKSGCVSGEDTGRRFKADGRGDIKYHAFGFHYRGDPISPKHLEDSGKIKEAYGVEHDGVQFVFLTLFRAHGCRRTMIPTLPYVLGLIPESVRVEGHWRRFLGVNFIFPCTSRK